MTGTRPCSAATAGYAQYAKDIRQEYIHFPEEQFREGRRRFLQQCLDQGKGTKGEGAGEPNSLFLTPLFKQRYHEQVGANPATPAPFLPSTSLLPAPSSVLGKCRERIEGPAAMRWFRRRHCGVGGITSKDWNECY